MAFNLLTDRLIQIETGDGVEHASLPEVLAALMADRVLCFPALRAHQVPAWHMFLAQLGAVACHRAGLAEPPHDAGTWERIVGALTRADFPGDEPWSLVVDDWSKPAFLQPPVPDGMRLKEDKPLATPDALDMLITSRNHDLKQAVAATAEPDDWIFALVSLQTMEGFGGKNNYGIARMNKGSSSRVLMGLVPLKSGAVDIALRPGSWLKRDITQLLERRAKLIDETPIPYRRSAGLDFTWMAPWQDGDQLALDQLDIWFIEVCRRVRLRASNNHINATVGNSSSERIRAKHLNGRVGDPWAPIHRTDETALTITENGRFDYKRVVDLLLSGDWQLPALAEPSDAEADEATNWLLVLAAIARGNSKTGGFQSRVLPLKGRIARRLGPKRQELHKIAREQTLEIKKLDAILRNALALAVARGDKEKINKETYTHTQPYRDRLDAVADRLFFAALWARFEAEQNGTPDDVERERQVFLTPLVDSARTLFEEGLSDMPCPSIHRPRAEARARNRFKGMLRNEKTGFPNLFATAQANDQETSDAA
jgi:CRISPR system Cascade subunit CasA